MGEGGVWEENKQEHKEEKKFKKNTKEKFA